MQKNINFLHLLKLCITPHFHLGYHFLKTLCKKKLTRYQNKIYIFMIRNGYRKKLTKIKKI